MESIGDFEYSKKDLIGHGAFAVVFKGRNRKRHDAVVAIKVITKKNLAKSQNLLSKEIKILKELSSLHHENVVALLDCKETSHHVYLVMEYCNGGDLADYLQVKGTLSEDTISQFFKQIAGAMRALNAKGIVHRDLKPQNILLCHTVAQPADTKLKIADFGFARFLQDGVMAATLCGSPMYMAPEVIMSLQYDAKADLWSVGTIMYQCLTGKAPFQAQTPQQLKQFYEKNSNLQPNIPSGTSRELKHLLMHLLKRNAKDRMEFDDFFRHPFLNPRPHTKTSSPVPVPRSASRGSLKAVSVSPLSGHMAPSPSPSTPRAREAHNVGQETMETASPQETVGGFLKVYRCNIDDYVMVPNTPEQLGGSLTTSAARKVSSCTDLSVVSEQQWSPTTGNKQKKDKLAKKEGCGCLASPSRPSSLPVLSSPSTSPIPVPSQVRAYQQIQRSMGQSPSSPGYPHSTPSPASPSPRYQMQPSPQIAPAVVTVARKPSSGSVGSVGSISPPAVQFTIGTPPSGNSWRRNSGGTPPLSRPPGGTPPLSRPPATLPNTVSCSPLKRTSSAASPLPTIVGSPTKMSAAFQFPVARPGHRASPTSPLNTPFASLRNRTRTCPDNIGAVGIVTEGRPRGASVDVADMDRCLTEAQPPNENTADAFSNQLLRAAFGSAPCASNTNTGTVQLPCVPSSPQRKAVGSQPSETDAKESEASIPHPSLYAQSPGNLQGPITFVAPELVEETLMDKAHKETVGKLNFVVALVECIIELAQSRSSPLSESLTDNTICLDHVSFSSQTHRRLEQLLLYVRALQLLASSLQLAQEEVAKGRLHVHSSSSVKLILKDMNSYYQQCLSVCRQLHNQGLPEDRVATTTGAAALTADKLIYSHAIEMCQTAALDELFGNPQECFRRYRNAQILLHSLAQQADSDGDRELLRKYKVSVEKRLYNLHNQGFVQMNVCDSACSS